MRERFRRGGALTALLITVFMDMVGFGIIIPLTPFWAERFGAAPDTVTLLFATYSAFGLRVLVPVGLGERQMGAQAGPAGEPDGLGAVVPLARLRRGAVDAVRRAGDRRDLRRQRRGGAGLYRRRDDGEEPRPGVRPVRRRLRARLRAGSGDRRHPRRPRPGRSGFPHPLHGGGGECPSWASCSASCSFPSRNAGSAPGRATASGRSSRASRRSSPCRPSRFRCSASPCSASSWAGSNPPSPSGPSGRSVGARARPGSSSPISGCC